MRKTFIRSILSSEKIECSWYDRNGRRYAHRFATWGIGSQTTRERDDKGGYMAYARKHDFSIIDDYNEEHPRRVNKHFVERFECANTETT